MRIDVALGEAVVGRIGVDQDSYSASRLRIAHLQSAKQAAVTGENDLAFDVDPHLFEGVEILGPAQVGVDDLSTCIARNSVPVKSTERQATGRILIGRYWRLIQ